MYNFSNILMKGGSNGKWTLRFTDIKNNKILKMFFMNTKLKIINSELE